MIVVAIDGHSSCGKSTMAKWLAKEVGYIYVDTGAMYRMVTLFALTHGFINVNVNDNVNHEEVEIDENGLKEALKDINVDFKLDPSTNLPLACLNGEIVEKEIRSMTVSNFVSPIAALPFVREKLTHEQQLMGEKKGIVMDGRDIGTAVFPNAELKIFVTASAAVRAQRRYNELLEKGQSEGVTLAEVQKNVEERDYIDSHREMNPLRQAEDAVVLDNSNMTKEEQNEFLLRLFNERTGSTEC
ncbi:MAG: (d)CMP kinase [Prevotellaceae bacterium]|nr:(d)CMP kinase [Candidatus Colivivens equi]